MESVVIISWQPYVFNYIIANFCVENEFFAWMYKNNTITLNIRKL